MGISELLKILKPIITEKHISELKGKTAAVDIMAWIYRGVYASAVDIGQGKDSSLYLNFPLKMLALLHSNQIDCIAVFDGFNLKAKENVAEIRSENKEKNLELAQKLLAEGKEEESRKIFRRSLKIKSKMLNTLIEILKRLGIRVIVAPYEADSQIAFLCKNGLADFAITEDSDLIPYGVNKIAFKLNITGYMSYLDVDAFRTTPLEKITDPSLRYIRKISANHLRLVEFCVMLGCDYLPSIKGYGIKTAVNLYETYEKTETVLHQMKFIDKFKKNIPVGYLEKLKKCVALFFMQTVYNPIENKLQSLTEISVNGNSSIECSLLETLIKYDKLCVTDSENFLGEMKIDNFKEFCNGDLDVKTLRPEKKLESNEIIEKYQNKYRHNFTAKSSKKKIVKNAENIQNETYPELNYDISHLYENCPDSTDYTKNLLDDSSKDKDFSSNTDNLIEINQNKILNLDKKVMEEYEFEMQYSIDQSLKSEQKKKLPKKIIFDKSINSELIEMMKIKETLYAEEVEKEINGNVTDNNLQKEKKYFNTNLSKTPENKKVMLSNIKDDLSSEEKDKSATKNIKSLFDIIEKEKEINFHTNFPKMESPLKLNQAKSFISPSFNRLASPNVENKLKISNTNFISGIKNSRQETNLSDSITSPTQCILSFGKINDPFNKNGESTTIINAGASQNKVANNIFQIKSSNNFDLNPNFFQKRKHSELPLPKALKFEKELKSGFDFKKSFKMDNFKKNNPFKK